MGSSRLDSVSPAVGFSYLYRQSQRMMSFGVCLALILTVACGQPGSGSISQEPRQVTGLQVIGLIVEVVDRDIDEVETLRIRDRGGKTWTFITEGYAGFSPAHLREHQLFRFGDWPTGDMTTPTLAGTRPGGAIAAAWAVMHYLGQDGYCAKARIVTETRKKYEDGLDSIGGFRFWVGSPNA